MSGLTRIGSYHRRSSEQIISMFSFSDKEDEEKSLYSGHIISIFPFSDTIMLFFGPVGADNTIDFVLGTLQIFFPRKNVSDFSKDFPKQ